jgi:ribose 5-phosphate isomerase A
MTHDPASLKRAAAAKALQFVRDGMKLGLGTGSTAEAFLDVLAASGCRITGTPTSERTAQKAKALGIALGELDALAPLDITVDGADEADRDLNLIKGGGGALLREKIVAASSARMIVIADDTKLVDRLGNFPLPVEIIPFGHATTIARIRKAIASLGYGDVAIATRMNDGAAFRTDSNNLIVDCAFGAIADAPALARTLANIPGVVDHGLFIGLATTLIVAGAGGVQIIEKP